MNPEIAIIEAANKFYSVRQVSGGYVYGFECLDNGEQMFSRVFPNAKQARYARYRALVETAVSWVEGGARAFEELCWEWPWHMRRAYLPILAAETGDRYYRKSWSPRMKQAQAQRRERERRDALLPPEKREEPEFIRMVRRYGPVHRTHAAAMETARRRIMAKHPRMSPRAVDALARWLAGCP